MKRMIRWNIVIPEISTQFLVFVGTTWAPKNKMQVLVARYGMKSINAQFLERCFQELPSALYYHGFIVDTIAKDGAAENRSAFKNTSTISAWDIFDGHVLAQMLSGLDLNFRIAYEQLPRPTFDASLHQYSS